LLDWPLLRSAGLHEAGFIDLKSVLESAQIYKTSGNEVFQFKPGVPGSGYMYGSFLLKILNFLQVNPTLTMLLGYFFVALTIFMLSITVTGYQIKSLLLKSTFYFAIYAPFVWLLQERGNIDTLIFFLLFIACYMLSKNFVMTFYLLVFITALIKFYTLPLLLIPWLFKIKIKNFRVLKIGSLVTFLSYVCFQILEDVGNSPPFPAGWTVSFGALNYASWINLFSQHFHLEFQINPRLVQAFFASLTLLAGFTLGKSAPFIIFHKALIGRNFEEKREFLAYICITFNSLFLVCFLVGSNYDYRLFTLFVASLSFLQLAKLDLRKTIVYIGLLMPAFWFSAFGHSSPYLQLIGDIAVNCWAIFSFGLLLFVYRKHYQIT
jgi:hypothetical protein